MSNIRTVLCYLCLILLAGCWQVQKPTETVDVEAQRAAMEARFAELDAKAAELPYKPIEVTEDGILILADANFMETVNEGGILVVDFWMDNCYACDDMAPVIKALARQYKDKVRFGKLHANTNLIMTEKYQVFGFPTFAFFVDGKLFGVLTGAQDPGRMRMILDKILLDYHADREIM